MSWRVWIVFQYVNLNYVPRQVTRNMFSAKAKTVLLIVWLLIIKSAIWWL